MCGGGTAITQKLEANDVPFKFGPGGREIESEEGINIAYQVLERQREEVERKLIARGISVQVITPVITIGDMICHVNGDWFVKAVYPNFNKIYVATLIGRTKTFAGFERIEVISF